MPKTIAIIGQKEVGKTTLFRQLVKKYSEEIKPKKIIAPLVNYVEEIIQIGNNFYKLIDTPTFIFKPNSEIEKEVKKQTEELIKKSDLIC